MFTHQQIEQAIVVFVKGFSSARSRTHPYEYERVEGVWVMRDATRRRPADYRKEEWVAFGIDPQIVDSLARRYARGRFYIGAICGLHQSIPEWRDAYKALGYRLLGTEGFFVHNLLRIPQCRTPGSIERVKTLALAVQLGKAMRARPIAPPDLTANAPFRQYVALDGSDIVGWVRSIVADEATWCSNMFVKPSHRRRGIGKALLSAMLRDDRANGAHSSVLLSSHIGALLYPKLGYQQIGTLLLLAPRISQSKNSQTS